MLELLLEVFFMFAYVGGSSFKKPLTPEEEAKYIREMESGDRSARDVLIERNMRLVAHIVKKYTAIQQTDPEELISIGTIGLIKAINTFKGEKGSKLATYASRCVENEILMYLRNNKKHRNDISLQDTVGVDKEGNEITLEDRLSDDGESIEEIAEKKAEIIRLRSKLDTLTERERYIITCRYGLMGGEEITQREVAGMLGISRSYVSRIEKRALEKLRYEMDME